MFSPSDFRELFQPNYCERRVWLTANRPELAVKDVEFIELMQEKGLSVEDAHVKTVGPIEVPEYPEGDIPSGYEDTLRLIEAKTPTIYQGVLVSKNGEFSSIPDLLIFNPKTSKYKIQEIKLARNIDNHPEIINGLGLSRLITEEVLGYTPLIEVITGDGSLISPFEVPDRATVLKLVNQIIELENMEEEPIEPAGWSKCNDCQFFDYCWGIAWKEHDVCTISGIEKGMVRALWGSKVNDWDDIKKLGNQKLAEVTFQRGSQIQRIGPTRADKIYRQARSLIEGSFEKKAELILPNGYSKGDRPIVIFDIENNIFDELGLQVDVYLWGLMTVVSDDVQEQELIVASPGGDGDADGWFDFLSTMKKIFERYGDVPVIHFSAHEKTKVNKYIDLYGDKNRVAKRVLKNLWDMYVAIPASVVLPVPSYGLKQIERFVGFERSQEEYGGSWSIVRYNQYLQASDEETAKNILNEIRTYNREDLLATYAIYKWLEENVC